MIASKVAFFGCSRNGAIPELIVICNQTADQSDGLPEALQARIVGDRKIVNNA